MLRSACAAAAAVAAPAPRPLFPHAEKIKTGLSLGFRSSDGSSTAGGSSQAQNDVASGKACWRAKKTKALAAVRVASALQLKLKGDLTAAHREQEAVVSAYYNGEGSLSEIRAGNTQKQESRQERRQRKEAQNKVGDYMYVSDYTI